MAELEQNSQADVDQTRSVPKKKKVAKRPLVAPVKAVSTLKRPKKAGDKASKPVAGKPKISRPATVSGEEEGAKAKVAPKKKGKRAGKKPPTHLGVKENSARVVKCRKLEFRFAVVKRLIRGVIWEKLGKETLYSSDAFHIVHQALEVFLGQRLAQARRVQIKVHPERMTLRASYLEASYIVEQRVMGNKEDPDLTLPAIEDKVAQTKKGKKPKPAGSGKPAAKKSKAPLTASVTTGADGKKRAKSVGKKAGAASAKKKLPPVAEPEEESVAAADESGVEPSVDG